MTVNSPVERLGYWFAVLSVLVARDHRARYKNTAIGMLWAVASPVLFLLTFYMLFSVIMRVNVPNYASFAFTGIIAWNWLQTSLNEGVASISHNSSLVSHPGFPLQTLPMASVTSNLINMLFSLPLLFTVILVEHVHLNWTVLLMPIIMIVQLVFQLSLVYFASAANVTFRDVQYILPVLLQLGYFMTPIFYDVGQLPQRFQDALALNPMSQIIQGYRAVLNGRLPNFTALGVVFAVSIVLLILGYRYFRSAAEHFLEEI